MAATPKDKLIGQKFWGPKYGEVRPKGEGVGLTLRNELEKKDIVDIVTHIFWRKVS